MRSATPWPRVRTGGAARTATCGLLGVAVAGAAMLAERRAVALQPGRGVVVSQLATGKLLIASRNLPDPNFSDTVVLLVEYSPDGAAGIVLNRPSNVPISRALPDLGAAADAAATAFIGGPVSQGSVIALSRAACEGCRRVGRDVHVVNTPEALQDRLAAGADERGLRVYLGYAGWGGGQLEAETRQGAWRVLDADARVVFDPDAETLWRRLIKRTEAVLALWMTPRL